MEHELERDPAFFAQDIDCAIRDMAERFSRDELLTALNQSLHSIGIEAVDYGRE
jgi:hypothetical protein